jgi:O-succinylbenzoate synthase
MKYRFEFRPYRRQFKQPLVTHHGLWEVREGIILRLTDEISHAGFGEIAPLSWFGSESFEQALDLCHHLPTEITIDDVFAVSSQLPACQFGLESAWEEVTSGLQVDQVRVGIVHFSGLLPSGKAALDSWRTLWHQGYRTFKWKIGIAPVQDEIKVFDALTQALPPEVKLRLDANGGLSLSEAGEWLDVCDRLKTIEFLEQPLAATQINEMLHLSKQYSTPLALDESVANLDQLKAYYQQEWRGIYVIKPSIAGSPKLLRQFCQQYEIDAVFSSVFETAIGKHAGLRLSADLGNQHRAAGFGVTNWFAKDDFFSEPEVTSFRPSDLRKPSPQEIWKHL